jgi:sensor c-di-GMP phosphodiesterase-like protein
VVHYQPIVALCSGKVVGAEALARWPQPDGSSLSPDIFVPLAEQTGLISQLTQLSLKKCLKIWATGCNTTLISISPLISPLPI